MRKTVQAADIIPAAVAQKIAQQTRVSIARVAKSKRAPLVSERSGAKDKYNYKHIHILQPRITSSQISIELAYSDVALAFEYGSKPHPIDAKNVPNLVFAGTNGYPQGNPGGLIRIPRVEHKGFQARPFMKTGKKLVRQKNLEELQKEVTKNIRLIISENKRVV